MPLPSNLINELTARSLIRDTDMKLRRIVNLSPSINLNDAVIRQELTDSISKVNNDINGINEKINNLATASAPGELVHIDDFTLTMNELMPTPSDAATRVWVIILREDATGGWFPSFDPALVTAFPYSGIMDVTPSTVTGLILVMSPVSNLWTFVSISTALVE